MSTRQRARLQARHGIPPSWLGTTPTAPQARGTVAEELAKVGTVPEQHDGGHLRHGKYRVTDRDGETVVIEQATFKFSCTLAVIPPGVEFPEEDVQFFKDDFGIKLRIDKVTCMACEVCKPWCDMNKRGQVWTRKACIEALIRPHRDPLQRRQSRELFKVMCNDCVKPLPGESSLAYLERLNALEAGHMELFVQVRYTVDGPSLYRPIDEVVYFGLEELNGQTKQDITEVFDRVARKVEQKWQEEPERVFRDISRSPSYSPAPSRRGDFESDSS